MRPYHPGSPLPIRTAKLSGVEPGQYCGGGPRGKAGCCTFSAFPFSFFSLSLFSAFFPCGASDLCSLSAPAGKCARSAPAESASPRSGGPAPPLFSHMCVLSSVLPESAVFLRERVFRGQIGHTVSRPQAALSRRSPAGRAPRGPLRGRILGPRQVLQPGNCLRIPTWRVHSGFLNGLCMTGSVRGG